MVQKLTLISLLGGAYFKGPTGKMRSLSTVKKVREILASK